MKKMILIQRLVLVVLAILAGYAFAKIPDVSPEKIESFSYLQAQAYREVWRKCLIDNHPEHLCKSLMIHDVQETLNGESPVSDGFLFTFTDSFLQESASIIYEVRVVSRGADIGKIYQAKKITKDQVNKIVE